MKQKQVGGDGATQVQIGGEPQKKRRLHLPKPKKPSWSKAMMVVIFAVCVEIIVYSEIVMWVHYDLSALYALVGVPVAMFGTFFAYAEKSKKENCAGGITYDMAMKELEANEELDPNEAKG